MKLRIYESLDQARQTILNRRNLTLMDQVPESLRAGIRRIFGQDLTPEEVAARIIDDVRRRGDESLREWSKRLYGVRLDKIEIPAKAFEKAHASLPADLAAALPHFAVAMIIHGAYNYWAIFVDF